METDLGRQTNKLTTNSIMALQIDKSEINGNKKTKPHYQLKKYAETQTDGCIYICIYGNILMCACARQCTHNFQPQHLRYMHEHAEH